MRSGEWVRSFAVMGAVFGLVACDGVWTFTGEVNQIPLREPAGPACTEVRKTRKVASECLEEIQEKTDDLLDLAERPGSDSQRAERMERLAAEIAELRVRAQNALPGSWETRDRVLEYRWSVDLRQVVDPFPSPRMADRLKIRSVTVTAVQAKVGVWPAEVPFEIVSDADGRWLTASARRTVNPVEACLDGERVFLEVEARVDTNLYGERTLKLRLKGGRP